MKSRTLPALVFLLAALASPATAQGPASAPLNAAVGSPIAYQIGLPRGWEVSRKSGMMFAQSKVAVVIAHARDLLDDTGRELPEAETRRVMTAMMMGSDSTVFGLMRLINSQIGEGRDLRDVTYAMGTLGGERAGLMSGWMQMPGAGRMRMEMYLTVRDGIAYVLLFMVQDSRFEAHRPLFTRVRDSFVPAPSPTFSPAADPPVEPAPPAPSRSTR